ncbi:MAG: delta-60 repeat domain-containing protein, partial [Verrucomicrobia bacterium]|nr:delta-60 repeat domain-containing protein [Verrucomicrobiota bacterium]
SNKDFAVVRYNPNGTLDTTFNGTGKVTTDFRGHDDVCSGMVLQDDGRIVVIGYSSDGTRNDFALARYNTDGTLDTGFGQLGTGKVVTTGIALASYSEAYAVALQADGKLVVVGTMTWPYCREECVVVRYNADGSVDDGFGSGGVMHFGVPENYGTCGLCVAVQGDGRIVVTGRGYNRVVGPGGFTARVDADGKRLDPGFAGGQKYEYTFSVNAAAVQADGRILMASGAFNLIRLNTDGNYDPGFGSAGRVNTAIGVGSNVAKGLVLQGDGK